MDFFRARRGKKQGTPPPESPPPEVTEEKFTEMAPPEVTRNVTDGAYPPLHTAPTRPMYPPLPTNNPVPPQTQTDNSVQLSAQTNNPVPLKEKKKSDFMYYSNKLLSYSDNILVLFTDNPNLVVWFVIMFFVLRGQFLRQWEYGLVASLTYGVTQFSCLSPLILPQVYYFTRKDIFRNFIENLNFSSFKKTPRYCAKHSRERTHYETKCRKCTEALNRVFLFRYVYCSVVVYFLQSFTVFLFPMISFVSIFCICGYFYKKMTN